MASLELRNVQKSYGNSQIATLKDIALKIDAGEFLILVGPSGCGKSTLMNCIAGLENITGGEILVDGEDISQASPKDRDIAMVFQSYALYPTMSVRDNIAFGRPDADHDEIGRDVRAVAQADAGDLGTIGLDRRDLHPEVNPDAGRGVARLRELGNLRGHRARHHPRCELDHIDLETLGPCGGGEFEPDEARADHDDAHAGRKQFAQRMALIEDAQVADRVQPGVRNIEQPVPRAGREHQVAVVERRAGGERHLPRIAVDRVRPIGDQLDLVVVVEFLGPEHQEIGRAHV